MNEELEEKEKVIELITQYHCIFCPEKYEHFLETEQRKLDFPYRSKKFTIKYEAMTSWSFNKMINESIEDLQRCFRMLIRRDWNKIELSMQKSYDRELLLEKNNVTPDNFREIEFELMSKQIDRDILKKILELDDPNLKPIRKIKDLYNEDLDNRPNF
jgi:hypothetical protein